MGWKTLCIIISAIALALYALGVGEKWEVGMLGLGLFLFVITFINISRSNQ